jgi:DNA-directed RNA polymerase II subunit RPB2
MSDATTRALQWAVVDAYFAQSDTQLVKHQLNSFDEFIAQRMESILCSFNPIEISHNFLADREQYQYKLSLSLQNPTLSQPMICEKSGETALMTPMDARLRNLTYAGTLSADVHVTAKTLNVDTGEYAAECKTLRNVVCGRIPIMVRSSACVLSNALASLGSHECPYDYGGYFIVNGVEKVVISQDRIAENKCYVFQSPKVSPYSHVAEVRSVDEARPGVPKTVTVKITARSNQFGHLMRVNVHHIRADIPLFVLFKALGVENDRDIMLYVLHDLEAQPLLAEQLVASAMEAQGIMCARDAQEYISRFLGGGSGGSGGTVGGGGDGTRLARTAAVRNILERELLPHMGASFHKKALYVGYMARCLLRCVMGGRELDDRDSYLNKRIDAPGFLLANLFRQYTGKLVKDMRSSIQREVNSGSWKATGRFVSVINKTNIYKVVKASIIDGGLRWALATGNWGLKSVTRTKQGVAQVLNRMTYQATLSHLRRCNTPIEKSGKLVAPRKLHPTQWGVMCCCETPEGASVGLVKSLALMVNITLHASTAHPRQVLAELGVRAFQDDVSIFGGGATRVVINGDIIGVHDHPDRLVRELRRLKRSGVLNVMTGIYWHILENEVVICTEGGRCARPLFVVHDASGEVDLQACRGLSWAELVTRGLVEYVDVEEANCSMIAMRPEDLTKDLKGDMLRPRYTHLEIHPAMILGNMAANIPFSSHNQAPRNCYQVSSPGVGGGPVGF